MLYHLDESVSHFQFICNLGERTGSMRPLHKSNFNEGICCWQIGHHIGDGIERRLCALDLTHKVISRGC